MKPWGDWRRRNRVVLVVALLLVAASYLVLLAFSYKLAANFARLYIMLGVTLLVLLRIARGNG